MGLTSLSEIWLELLDKKTGSNKNQKKKNNNSFLSLTHGKQYLVDVKINHCQYVF